jgi:hypothetical protein
MKAQTLIVFFGIGAMSLIGADAMTGNTKSPAGSNPGSSLASTAQMEECRTVITYEVGSRNTLSRFNGLAIPLRAPRNEGTCDIKFTCSGGSVTGEGITLRPGEALASYGCPTDSRDMVIECERGGGNQCRLSFVP